MAALSMTPVERVASLFDEAPLEPSRWHAALRGLASLTGSGRAELVGIDKVAGTSSFDWISDDESMLRDQAVAIGAYQERFSFRVAASKDAAAMTIIDERHYDTARNRLSDDRYVEFTERNAIPFGCQTSLLIDRNWFVGLALLRAREDGRTDADQRAIFAEIAPRVRAAVQLQIAIERQGHHLALGVLDAVSTKALLIDGTGRVREMTPAADRLLRGTRRMWVKDGRIETPVPLETRRIAQAIHDAAERRTGEATIILSSLVEGDARLQLAIHPVSRQPWNLGVAPSAIVVLKGGPSPTRARRALMMEKYGLTSAEAEVVVALTEGDDRNRIAATRNVSIATIRTQLKTIYQKMGVVREAELVARATALFQTL